MSRTIQAFRVGNFKAFADTQRIPIKPITLIFGPNSAGKSSFIHSLALAHEALSERAQASGSPFDIHHTKIGGSAIDLGGFRQYVHRGQLNKHVEWGIDLELSEGDLTSGASPEGEEGKRLGELRNLSIKLAIGIDLDDQDRPAPGAHPELKSVEIVADGIELVRMSQRPHRLWGVAREEVIKAAQFQANPDSAAELMELIEKAIPRKDLRLDRIAREHPFFMGKIQFHVMESLRGKALTDELFSFVQREVSRILPDIIFIPYKGFFPELVLASNPLDHSRWELDRQPKGRKDRISNAACKGLLSQLATLLKFVRSKIDSELENLGYLGPLRSFPSRHLGLGQPEDANWFAGGASTWDVVRRNTEVRDAVNVWLSSSKLRTPYKLVVRPLVALNAMKEILETRLEEIEKAELEITPGDFPADIYPSAYPQLGLPQLKDHQQSLEKTLSALLEQANANTSELVLEDQRTRTLVTHRDVGIGISQVLPVLVMAYGSNKKMLAMEQPEIHLHPALQAELGDVFIESALGERQNTFILETHSEHLILRLMRRMRETHEGKNTGLPPITPDDIAVLYVEPDGSRSIVREMPLNEMGELVKSWPGGFFEEGLREQFGDD